MSERKSDAMSDGTFERPVSRRAALKAVGAFALASGLPSCDFSWTPGGISIPGRVGGANHQAGHMLWKQEFPEPRETARTGIVIVGAGIAGLSAAWWLKRMGFQDFQVLELENHLGGNAASGQNDASAYPLGAHYVPIPNDETVLTRKLFEELGVITGYDGRGWPIYDEYYLVADLQERLFIGGQWQEGIVPQLGVPAEDRRQYRDFFGQMEAFRKAVGTDGRRAFAIPLDLSSADEGFRRLDRISMGQYMRDRGWNSRYLQWYVNYCCRDDYGSTLEHVSAWAGIHYFASRNGRAANSERQSLVTWPEGNGFIVDRLKEGIGAKFRTGSLVFNIENVGPGVIVDSYDLATKRSSRILAKTVIFCGPRFVAKRVLRELRDGIPDPASGHTRPNQGRNLDPGQAFVYAPWLIANVTVKYVPVLEGVPLAWDNVNFYGESLGYIVATHQSLNVKRRRTVLTCYYPLSGKSPPDARREQLQKTYDEWARMIVDDLNRSTPGIEKLIERIDVWLWGHGMIRPGVGFIWGKDRAEALRPIGRILFANSDMSGISIFEEAQYRGVTAATAALGMLEHGQNGNSPPADPTG